MIMENNFRADCDADSITHVGSRSYGRDMLSAPSLEPYEDEEDAEERLAKSRDRNREHARRTRLRKKAQLQSLQNRVKELENESRLLRQTLEECSIASILLGLSGNNKDNDDDLLGINSCLTRTNKDRKFFTMNGKRKRFVSDEGDIGPQPMKLVIKGQTTLVGGGGGKAHINWKTGVYLDEHGDQQQLSPDELDTLRRERNRMHAKMTRDRKKLYISSVEKTIAELEDENKHMRELLAKQAMVHTAEEPMTPEQSPSISSVDTNVASIPAISLQPCGSFSEVPEAVFEGSSPESFCHGKGSSRNVSGQNDDTALLESFSVVA